jgi:uncharacterized protein (TIGR04255 family)
MNDINFKLPYPPIVEAVLDIECDLPPNYQLSDLEEPSRNAFRDHYPTYRTQFIQEYLIEAKSDAPVATRKGLQAFQFLQDGEKQLVQVRVQGYSFNRLTPYSSLDDYLPEIERTWRLYIVLAKPVQVRLIRLRYINRILLPLEEGRVELNDYFKVAPKLPDEDKLTLTGFLNQHAAVENATGNQINLVLTTQPLEGNRRPVIFDNAVIAPKSGEPEDWPWISSQILVLRDLKNRIFKRALTDKCLDLFQQQP